MILNMYSVLNKDHKDENIKLPEKKDLLCFNDKDISCYKILKK